MVTRAAVKTIAGFAGINPPREKIDVQLDQPSFTVGSEVTGTVRLMGKSNYKSVHILLEGMEYTVVATAEPDDSSTVELDYLKNETTEKNILLEEEVVLDCSQAQKFCFKIPEELPSTMRFVLDKSHPTLPSQCQVKYTIKASLYRNGNSKTQVAHPVLVKPKPCPPEPPLESSLSVSIGSSLDLLFKSLFSCSDQMLHCHTEPELEAIASVKYILLEPSSDVLHLSAGQSLGVAIQDWFGLLQKPNKRWMIRLGEELSWTSQGRTAHYRQNWDLGLEQGAFIVPSTLRRTYTPDTPSLFRVRHAMTIYLASEENKKELVATTEPIELRIVASQGDNDVRE